MRTEVELNMWTGAARSVVTGLKAMTDDLDETLPEPVSVYGERNNLDNES